MIQKLRQKLILTFMGVSVLVLFAIFLTIYLSSMQSLESESFERLRNATPGPGFISQSPFLTVEVSRSGELATTSTEDESILWHLIDAAVETGGDQGKFSLDGSSYLFVARNSPRGTSYTFSSGENLSSSSKSLITSFIPAALIALVALFFLSRLLTQWMVRPVEKAFQGQKQFVSDASHELKTPLSVILSSAQLMSDPMIGEDEKTMLAENVLEEAGQMKGLVEELLELSRAESDQLPYRPGSVDLSELAESAALSFEPVFFENGRELETDIEPDLICTGEAAGLTRILYVLLDNAVKYSSGPGAVVLSLHRLGHRIILAVESPGQPISKEEREKLFERFTRLDQSRNSEGYGLGLALAARIAERHHAELRVISPDHTNRFELILPDTLSSANGKTAKK